MCQQSSMSASPVKDNKQQQNRGSPTKPRPLMSSPPMMIANNNSRNNGYRVVLSAYSYEQRQSPPMKKQLAGGKMHGPPKPEDLPVPPMDWCGREAAMECELASSMLKRMLKVSA